MMCVCGEIRTEAPECAFACLPETRWALRGAHKPTGGVLPSFRPHFHSLTISLLLSTPSSPFLLFIFKLFFFCKILLDSHTILLFCLCSPLIPHPLPPDPPVLVDLSRSVLTSTVNKSEKTSAGGFSSSSNNDENNSSPGSGNTGVSNKLCETYFTQYLTSKLFYTKYTIYLNIIEMFTIFILSNNLCYTKCISH